MNKPFTNLAETNFSVDPEDMGDPEDTSELEELLNNFGRQLNSENDLSFLEGVSHIGKYRIDNLLGVGGQAVCLKGFDEELKRPVVVKVYRDGISPIRTRSILQEGRALAKIKSPHVSQCFVVGEHEDRPYLILEHFNGQSLDQWSERNPINETAALAVARQVIAGLAAVHRNNQLHLDLKPENVLIDSRLRVLLIDFGLSQSTFDEQQYVGGSPSYLAPERLNNQSADERIDVYGVGAILYFLLTGSPPVEGDTKKEILDCVAYQKVDFEPLKQNGVSRKVISIIGKCLEKNPDERFSSVGEVSEALAPTSLARRFWPALVGLGCLLLVGGTTLAQLSWAKVNDLNHGIEATGMAVVKERLETELAGTDNLVDFVSKLSDFEIELELARTSDGVSVPLNQTGHSVVLQGNSEYKLNFTASCDCYVGIFNLGYKAADSKHVDLCRFKNDLRANEGFVRKGESLSFSIKAKPSEASRPEFIYVVASTYPIDGPLLADITMEALSLCRENETWATRDVNSDSENELLSSAGFPYVVGQ